MNESVFLCDFNGIELVGIEIDDKTWFLLRGVLNAFELKLEDLDSELWSELVKRNSLMPYPLLDDKPCLFIDLDGFYELAIKSDSTASESFKSNLYLPFPEHGDWDGEFLNDIYKNFLELTGQDVGFEGFINGYVYAGLVYEMGIEDFLGKKRGSK